MIFDEQTTARLKTLLKQCEILIADHSVGEYTRRRAVIDKAKIEKVLRTRLNT
jgi:hypothetical protein